MYIYTKNFITRKKSELKFDSFLILIGVIILLVVLFIILALAYKNFFETTLVSDLI